MGEIGGVFEFAMDRQPMADGRIRSLNGRRKDQSGKNGESGEAHEPIPGEEHL